MINNFQNKFQQLDSSVLDKKTEEIETLEPSLPVNTETLMQPFQFEKISPQRSEEVQAYLDFIESTTEKLIELIGKGWTRLQALVMKYRKNN